MKKKKKKVSRRIGRGDSVDSLIMGSEPVWKDADKLTPEEYDTKILKAINWYSYSCDNNMCKPWVIDWMMKNEYSKKDIKAAAACDINAMEFIYIGSRCRIMNLGAKLRPETLEMIKCNIDQIIQHGLLRPTKVEDPNKEKVNIQERILKKSVEYMGTVESRIDELYGLAVRDALKNVDHNEWLKMQGIKPVHFKRLVKVFDPHIKELKTAYKGQDEDLKEGFSFLGKRKIKQMITTLEEFKDILNG
ncbi:MAG: hypothetical protein EB127_30370 [Alphaproteobacteria bacterium]|nr:hypothetical protein [Alphaproteobacteria bacterium]